MPRQYPKVCSTPGCIADAAVKSGKCEQHQEAAWARSKRSRRITTEFARNRAKALRTTNGRCGFCATATSIVDHRLPVAWGGGDNMENLQPLCDQHHTQKTREESVLGRAIARGRIDAAAVSLHVERWTPSIARYR